MGYIKSYVTMKQNPYFNISNVLMLSFDRFVYTEGRVHISQLSYSLFVLIKFLVFKLVNQKCEHDIKR